MKKASRLLRNIALLMAMLILVSVPVTMLADELLLRPDLQRGEETMFFNFQSEFVRPQV